MFRSIANILITNPIFITKNKKYPESVPLKPRYYCVVLEKNEKIVCVIAKIVWQKQTFEGG